MRPQKGLHPLTIYNGPLTYNNAVKDFTSCYTIHKQNKLIYEINK
jgi:hypothetical protein